MMGVMLGFGMLDLIYLALHRTGLDGRKRISKRSRDAVG